MFDVPSERTKAARSLWSQGLRADALKLFSEAIRQEPNNVRPYVATARAYAEMFDFEGMEQVHARLVRQAPRHPGVHHCIGETFELINLPERSIESYERAARLPGAGPPTWIALASLYERAHRLDEAEELVNRAAPQGCDLPILDLLKARIQRRQNQPEQAKATLQTLLARLPEDTVVACQSWSELALMMDREGDFDGACRAIERSKRLQKAHEAPFWQASQKLHDQMREMNAAVTRDDFLSWQDAVRHLDQHRVALLTGFPRSGTTLLGRMLAAHPEMALSEERDFIGREVLHAATVRHGKRPLIDGLRSLTADDVRLQRQRYYRAMEYLGGEAIGERTHLDKNPAYNMTIPMMLRVFPEARLIIVLRDPRDVVLSCYMRYLPLNAVSVCFLDVQRTALRYALDMEAWLKFRELVDVPWCEVRYEDTIADLEAQIRRVLAGLELPWKPEVLNYRDHGAASKIVTSPSYEAVAQPIYAHANGRWKNYERLLEPARKILDPFIREFGYGS
jgi:tetratricopeptide (TPR) repeat protein